MKTKLKSFSPHWRNQAYVAWHLQRKPRRGPLWRDVVGLWELEENAGQRYDRSGYFHTLTDNNTVPQVMVKGAAYFPGDPVYFLSVADNASLNLAGGSFFVFARVMLLDTSAGGVIISKYTSAGNNREFWVTYDAGIQRFRVRYSNDGNSVANLNATSFGAPSEGVWYTIVVWVDYAANQVGISVNGISNTAAFVGGVVDGTAPLMISGSETIGSSSRIYIDTVAVWKGAAPSAGDVTELNTGPQYGDLSSGIKTNLVSWWDLDDTGSLRYDSHGTNHLSGSTLFYAPNGYAAQMQAINGEYLSIPSNGLLQGGDRDFSFNWSFWINDKSAGRTIFAKHNGGGALEYHGLYDSTLDRMRFRVSPDGSTYASVAADNFGSPPIKKWIHGYTWHDAANNQIGIRINNGAPNIMAHAGGVISLGSPFTIGRTQNGTAQHDGYIGQVVRRNRLLTEEEQAKSFNNGLILRSSTW